MTKLKDLIGKIYTSLHGMCLGDCIMTDQEIIANNALPKYDYFNTFTVRVLNQLRQVRRVGNNEMTSLTPGTLIFTDCTHPMQNVICPEAEITAWYMNAPKIA